MQAVRRFAFPLLLVLLTAACQSSEERAETFFQSGLELRQEGDLARAAVEFRNVFQYEGTHKGARLNLAEILIEQGNPNAAFSQYLRLAEQYPEDPDVRIALSELAVAQQAWSALERHGSAAIKFAPDTPKTQAIAAMLAYIEATQSEDAEAQFEALSRAETLLADDPELDVARRLLIIGRLSDDDLDAGLAAIDEALERSPDDVPLNTLKLQVLNSLDRPDEVEALLQDMYARFPDNEQIGRDLIAWYVRSNNLTAVEDLLRERAGSLDGQVDDHLALVQFIAETEGPEAARAELGKLIEANADSPAKTDRYVIVDANFASALGERQQAIAALQARLDDETETKQTTQIKTTLAEIMIAAGNQVGARALVEEVLAEDAGNVDALKMRASWLIDADKPTEAINELRTALDQAPNDPDILTLMAMAHMRAGSTQLAGERLSLAVDMSNNGVVESLRYARFLQQQDRISAALAVMDEALGVHPGSVELLTEQARMALVADDITTARAAIARIESMQDNPAAVEIAKTLQAALLLDQNQIDEGLALLEERAEGENAPRSYVLDVLQTRLRAGQVDEAKAYLDERLDERPEDPALRYADAVLKAAEGDIGAAETILRDLIDAFPQADAPVVRLYEILGNDGREQEAQEVLEAGFARIPNSRAIQFFRAGRLESEGNYEEAIGIYEAIYQGNSNDVVAANNLASLLSELRTDQESLSRAGAIVSRLKDTDIPAFQDTYGWVAYRQGNYEEALSYLEPAATALPDNAIAQYHLGMTYLALERVDDARTALSRAVELADGTALPQISEAREALEGL